MSIFRTDFLHTILKTISFGIHFECYKDIVWEFGEIRSICAISGGNHLVSLLAGQILWKKTEKKGKCSKNIESHRLGRPQSMIQLSAFWCAPLNPSELLKERNATQKGFYLVCENHILNYIYTVNYATCGQYFKQKRVHVCLLLPLFFCISPQQCGKCSYEKSCFYSHTANYITAG